MGAASAGANRLSPAAGAARCGTELREARERLGWDLGEIAAALRIRLAYLQAIEDGKLSALPGNTYALGFLRTYATTLGLDADDVARRFRAEAVEVNRRTELAFPSPVPERGVPTGAALLSGFAILVAAYVLWFHWSAGERAPTRTVPPVPPQLLAAHRAAPVSPQVASVMPATPGPALPANTATGGSTAPAAPQGAVGARPPNAQEGSSSSTPAGTAPTAPAGAPTTGSPTALPSSAPPATAVAPGVSGTTAPGTASPPLPGAATSGPVLLASAPAWLEVRDATGSVIFDRVLQTGERWAPPTGPGGFTFTTGNAGGLQIVRNGVAGAPLGRNGAVLRHVALDNAAPATAAPATVAPAPAAVEGSASGSGAGAEAPGAGAGSDTGQAPTGPIARPTTPSEPARGPDTTTANGEAAVPLSGSPAAAPANAPAATSVAPPVHRRAVRPVPPPAADDSADALNARELGAHATTSRDTGH